MTLPALLDDRAAMRPRRAANVQPRPELIRQAPDRARRPELSTAELAFRIYAAFRAHPHVCNVLTHISRASWSDVEKSINAILDPATCSDDLSPLGRNIVELMVAERGISGKILKPYFHVVLLKLLGPLRSKRLIRRIGALYLDVEWKTQHPVQPPAPGVSPEDPDHVRSELQ